MRAANGSQIWDLGIDFTGLKWYAYKNYMGGSKYENLQNAL